MLSQYVMDVFWKCVCPRSFRAVIWCNYSIAFWYGPEEERANAAETFIIGDQWSDCGTIGLLFFTLTPPFSAENSLLDSW